MSKGKLFVISGASGVGKSTVLAQVMAKREDLLFSVSATTRQMRPGEIDGVSYYFISKDEFQQMIRREEFVEYDAHMDNWYGTPRAQLEEKLNRANVILDIEPNGAFAVKKARPDAVLVFIAPPSLEELERRLRNRGTEGDDVIKQRLFKANEELGFKSSYDYIVENNFVEQCAESIINIYENEK